MRNEFQRSLREVQDFSDDVLRSRYNTFGENLKRFATVLMPDKAVGKIIAKLPVVNFDEWYKQQEESLGGMLGSGHLSWPDDHEQRLSLKVELIRRLASSKLDFRHFVMMYMYVRNDFDANLSEFLQQFFRPFVRDFIRFLHEDSEFESGLQENKDGVTEKTDPAKEEITLFISHSSKDVVIVKALISLFEKAIKISARNIRCTSVDGYRLPVGAHSDEVLRSEVHGTKLFIGLITPASIASQAVLFELGARWGANKTLFPVLAGGILLQELRWPLSNLNALSLFESGQVWQLVENVADKLNVRLEPIASFSTEIDAVVSAAKTPPS